MCIYLYLAPRECNFRYYFNLNLIYFELISMYFNLKFIYCNLFGIDSLIWNCCLNSMLMLLIWTYLFYISCWYFNVWTLLFWTWCWCFFNLRGVKRCRLSYCSGLNKKLCIYTLLIYRGPNIFIEWIVI